LQNEEDGSAETGGTDQPPPPPIAPKETRAPDAAAQRSQQEEATRQKLDQDMVKWTRAVALLTGALVFVGLCQIGTALLQWHEMQTSGVDTHNLAASTGNLASAAKSQASETTGLRQATQDFAAAMRRQADGTTALAQAATGQLREMRDEQRPTVFVSSVENYVPLQTDPIISTGVKFTLINSGKSAAILAYPHAKLILGFNTDVFKRQRDACAAPVKAANGTTKVGFNIPAGASMPVSVPYALTEEDTKIWKAKPAGRILLVGCIDYMFDYRHHHAPFVEEVDKRAANPDGWAPINPNTDKINTGELTFLIPPWYTAQPD
jgi:hypothetical protein